MARVREATGPSTIVITARRNEPTLKNTADKKVAAKIPLIKLCTGVFLAGLPAMMSGSFDTRALSRYTAAVVLAAARHAASMSTMNFFFSIDDDKNLSAYPLLFLLLYAEQAGQPRAVKAWMMNRKKFESKRVEV